MKRSTIFGKYLSLTFLAAVIALIAFIVIFLVDFNVRNQRFVFSSNATGSGSHVCYMGFRHGYEYKCNLGGLISKMCEEFLTVIIASPLLLVFFGVFTLPFLLLAAVIIFVSYRNETKWHNFKVPKKRFFVLIVSLIFLFPTLFIIIPLI